MSNENKKHPAVFPDVSRYQVNIACNTACPVGTDVRAMVCAIQDGRYRDAYRFARAHNPFASMCGRVCEAPCESSCIRSNFDAPVTIRPLERFVCSLYGPESGQPNEFTLSQSMAPGSVRPESNGFSVGIIGSGPAGLTCVHDLARLGYDVTVYEKNSSLGGRLRQIPPFRCPEHIYQAEIEAILSLGIDIKLNHEAEPSALQEKHNAVCIAAGAIQSLSLDSELGPVQTSTRFLSKISAGGHSLSGQKVAIISLAPGDALLTLDCARWAVRMGARRVEYYCMQAPSATPYIRQQVSEAVAEGCLLFPGYEHCQISAGGRVQLGHRKHGKAVIKADVVVMDAPWRPAFQKTDLSEDCFVAGDMRSGRKMVIEAVADGSRAALEIHEYLSGTRLQPRSTHVLTPVHSERQLTPGNWRETIRTLPPTLPVRSRFGALRNCTQQVEFHFSENSALKQSDRCFKCHINTVFDANLCTLCNKCVEACPEDVLSIVLAESVEVGEGKKPSDSGYQVILRDDAKCTRCGICADVCPEKAITMQAFDVCIELLSVDDSVEQEEATSKNPSLCTPSLAALIPESRKKYRRK